MGPGLKSFLRDCWNGYVLYMTVVLGALPAAVTYATLTLLGYTQHWILLLTVGVGAAMGIGACYWTGQKFFA